MTLVLCLRCVVVMVSCGCVMAWLRAVLWCFRVVFVTFRFSVLIVLNAMSYLCRVKLGKTVLRVRYVSFHFDAEVRIGDVAEVIGDN